MKQSENLMKRTGKIETDLLSSSRKDQSGITGLEIAFVLIALVVVAYVFVLAVISTPNS